MYSALDNLQLFNTVIMALNGNYLELFKAQCRLCFFSLVYLHVKVLNAIGRFLN